MMLFKIAFRNILRNSRRSLMTILAIAVGAVALIVFGEFMAYITLGFKTQTVERTGHLTVFRAGYFDFGGGNPAAWGIDDYKSVLRLIAEDPALKPMINVVTPTVTMFGIAGNFDIDVSKTFLGVGVVPSDRDRMRRWNQYGLTGGGPPAESGLRDDDPTRGVIGVGLARVLGLCKPLKIANCRELPKAPASTAATADVAPSVDLSDLSARDREAAGTDPGDGAPRIDLLAATAGGAPNVISLYVDKAEQQGAKELDDVFVAMHLSLAQQLLYGRGEPKAVGIVIQLHRSEEMAPARARLAALFAEHGLDLEVRDFTELQPQYNQVIGLFGAIFSFIAAIMAVIVLFTVVNTMSMSVMERTNEIGTARAMGVRRRGIRRQFLVEGWMLGAIGASVGLILASFVAFAVNRSGLTWSPPGQATSIQLRLLTGGVTPLIAAIWLGLVLMATVAAWIPAHRAARMAVVDALRHV
jgi:putative ABC transport system permease protein